eukprot:2960295-Pleurochrysis_carterae.AAC.1
MRLSPLYVVWCRVPMLYCWRLAEIELYYPQAFYMRPSALPAPYCSFGQLLSSCSFLHSAGVTC